jgi:hypothetical protein
MHTRRQFIGGVAGAAAWAAVPGKDEISLAAWSINRSFFVHHRWTNLELPKICRETFGIGALEFVNQFFANPSMTYLNQLKKNAHDHNVRLVRIMVATKATWPRPIARSAWIRRSRTASGWILPIIWVVRTSAAICAAACPTGNRTRTW